MHDVFKLSKDIGGYLITGRFVIFNSPLNPDTWEVVIFLSIGVDCPLITVKYVHELQRFFAGFKKDHTLNIETNGNEG